MRPAPPRQRRDPLTPIVAGVAVTLFWGTVAGSHANPAFDRVRRLDRTGILLPNWRFFAPSPAQHDFHVLFRTSVRGLPTPWEEVQPITRRHWLHAVWFPGRRREKGIFDLFAQLTQLEAVTDLRQLPRTPPYRIMRGLVAERVRAVHAGRELPARFQFALVKYSGVDDSEDPQYVMVSPWESAIGLAVVQDAR